MPASVLEDPERAGAVADHHQRHAEEVHGVCVAGAERRRRRSRGPPTYRRIAAAARPRRSRARRSGGSAGPARARSAAAPLRGPGVGSWRTSRQLLRPVCARPKCEPGSGATPRAPRATSSRASGMIRSRACGTTLARLRHDTGGRASGSTPGAPPARHWGARLRHGVAGAPSASDEVAAWARIRSTLGADRKRTCGATSPLRHNGTACPLVAEACAARPISTARRPSLERDLDRPAPAQDVGEPRVLVEGGAVVVARLEQRRVDRDLDDLRALRVARADDHLRDRRRAEVARPEPARPRHEAPRSCLRGPPPTALPGSGRPRRTCRARASPAPRPRNRR